MGNISSACSIKGKHLFNWNAVPGDDKEKFLAFLSREYSLSWIRTARIEKVDESKTIRVFNGSNLILLKLNEENDEIEINIELDDGRSGKLIMCREKDKQKIYKEDTISIRKIREDRICQGDIIKNVKYIESFKEDGDYYEVSMINFPLVVIMSQDCDLNEDYQFRYDIPKKHKDHDKIMFSLLVAPIYTAAQVLCGDHLSLLDPPNMMSESSRDENKMKMQDLRKENTPSQPKSVYEHMKNNEIPRYHFLTFPTSVDISDAFIDFKHYFSINVNYLEELKRNKNNFVCRIDMPYRESISQRFSNYLSRIGLP